MSVITWKNLGGGWHEAHGFVILKNRETNRYMLRWHGATLVDDFSNVEDAKAFAQEVKDAE